MRRFVALPFALLFLIACASSRHTPAQTIGVQISAPPPPVEWYYRFDINDELAKAITSDFAGTIGPVALDAPADRVPFLSVTVVWERYGPAVERPSDRWFTLHYKLTTAAGVREGSVAAWGVEPTKSGIYPSEPRLVVQRAVASLRTAIQKSL